MEKTRHILYRWYNTSDELLYVGITKNPKSRSSQHLVKDWAKEETLKCTTYEYFNSREEVEAAEREAIVTEFPIYNTRNRGIDFDKIANKILIELEKDYCEYFFNIDKADNKEYSWLRTNKCRAILEYNLRIKTLRYYDISTDYHIYPIVIKKLKEKYNCISYYEERYYLQAA